MNITCPSCKSRYTVDDARVPASGVTIKCPNCQHKFVARAPGGTKPPGAVALPGRAPATPPDAAPPGPKSSGAVALPGTSGTGRSEPFQAPSRAVPLPGSGPRAPSQDVPQTDAGSLDLGFDGSGELEMPSTGSLDFIDDASGKAQAEPLFTTPELRVRHRNGRVEGPYGLERIKALLKAGELSGNEDVSSDGLSWRAMTAHPELNGFLNTLAGAQDALAFGQVDLDPGGSIDISAPSAPSMPTPGELDLGLDPEPSSPSPGTGPLFTPPPPVDAGPPGPSAVDELRQSLDLDVPPVAPAGSSALEAGGLTPPVPRDLLEVGEIPDMPPFWETYRRPIIAFLSVAALFLVGVVTHFMTPYGAFGIPRLVETLTYEPPPPPPPAPPPALRKLSYPCSSSSV
ncbi:MAG: zinc-ribbon domain-containing protein [Myxococcota bacterium]